jgi:hypothetical protein
LRAAGTVYHPWYARPGRLFLLLLAVGIAVGWSIARLGYWLPKRAHGLRHPLVAWSLALPVWIGLAAAMSSLAPGAAYMWLLPLLGAGLMFATLPVSSAGAVRAASVVIFLITATLWLPNTADLLRFTVAIFGRLPIVTPVFVYAAVMAAAGLMLMPPLVAALARTERLRFPKLATAACLLAVAATAKFAHMAPAYTNEEPLRRVARAVQEGDGPAIWDVGSVEPGVDLAEGAPAGWMPAAAAPTASVPLRRLPHPFVFRSTAPSLGPAPITIAALTVEPVAAGIELAVTVTPHDPGLAVSFVLPDGIEPARSNFRGAQRLGRWTATYLAPAPEGVVFRASFGQIDASRLRGFRVVATALGPGDGSGWQPPSWLPPSRTAWTAEAAWIVAPFDLPIAPVPPLR